MHRKKGGDCHTNLIFSFLIIYIIVPLHRRMFFRDHIILVFKLIRATGKNVCQDNYVEEAIERKRIKLNYSKILTTGNRILTIYHPSERIILP